MEPYMFNKSAVYASGASYKLKKQYDFVYLSIYTSETSKFTARVRDIFSQYKLPNVHDNRILTLWGYPAARFLANNAQFRCLMQHIGVRGYKGPPRASFTTNSFALPVSRLLHYSQNPKRNERASP